MHDLDTLINSFYFFYVMSALIEELREEISSEIDSNSTIQDILERLKVIEEKLGIKSPYDTI